MLKIFEDKNEKKEGDFCADDFLFYTKMKIGEGTRKRENENLVLLILEPGPGCLMEKEVGEPMNTGSLLP